MLSIQFSGIINSDWTKILKKEYNLFGIIKGEDTPIVLRNGKIVSNETSYYFIYISDELKNIIGEIHFIISDDETQITSIDTSENYRGQGVAHFLMIICALFTKNKNKNIKNIKLDDMSKNYRTQNNLYVNVGCTYEDESCGTEMICDVDKVLSKYKDFIQKFQNKNNSIFNI